MNSFVSTMMCGKFINIIANNCSTLLYEYTILYLSILFLSLCVVSDIWPYEHFFCSYSLHVHFCEHSKQVQWWTHVFISPEYVPKSEIVGSLDMVYSTLVDPTKEFPKAVVPTQKRIP